MVRLLGRGRIEPTQMAAKDQARLAQARQEGYLVLSASRKGITGLEGAWRKACWTAQAPAIVVRSQVTRARVLVDLTPARLVFQRRAHAEVREALTAGLPPEARRTQVVWSDGGSVRLALEGVPAYVATLRRVVADPAYVCLEPFYADYCQREARRAGPGEEEPMAVKLYRNEQGYAMQTECETEEVFVAQCARLLGTLAEDATYQGHWAQVLQGWLPQLVNICCAYRGYKVPDVRQRTLYTAGTLTPLQAEEPVHSLADDAQLLAEALRGTNGHQGPFPAPAPAPGR